MEEKARKLLALARDMARQPTEDGIDKAADILLQLIQEGNAEPIILVTAAMFLLQSSKGSIYEIKSRAITLVDKAVKQNLEDINVLENAIHCYELALGTFPDKLNEIVRLSLKILDVDPEHIDSMIILANHREHPYVALNLSDAIRMLEWAKEVEPENTLIDFTLARLYTEAGRFIEARKLYKKVIDDSQPDSKDALNARHHIKTIRGISKHRRYRKYGVN